MSLDVSVKGEFANMKPEYRCPTCHGDCPGLPEYHGMFGCGFCGCRKKPADLEPPG